MLAPEQRGKQVKLKFSITLPVVVNPAVAMLIMMVPNDTLNGTRTAAPLRAEKIRLLIADDNPAVLRKVCVILKDRFHIVAAVSNGEAVLDQYAALVPDAIILDISMGRLSGLDVAKTLRERGCSFPIVFLTVHTGDDTVNAALSSGGSGYVVKSHLWSDLVPAIEAALSGKLFVSSPAF